MELQWPPFCSPRSFPQVSGFSPLKVATRLPVKAARLSCRRLSPASSSWPSVVSRCFSPHAPRQAVQRVRPYHQRYHARAHRHCLNVCSDGHLLRVPMAQRGKPAEMACLDCCSCFPGAGCCHGTFVHDARTPHLGQRAATAFAYR